MQWQFVVFAILPIVAFMLVQALGSEKKALIAAIIVAALEAAYNSYQLGLVEGFSLISFGLFLVLGGLSIKTGKLSYFKFQPVILGLVLAAVFLVYNYAYGVPLFAVIMKKYVGLFELIPTYQKGYYEIYVQAMSKSLPFLLLFHAGLTAYAALKLSTWWWFHVRVFGFYLLLFLLFFAERMLGVSY